jgi:hypothetical protein
MEAAMGQMFENMIANTPAISPFIGPQEKERKRKPESVKLINAIE